jgi:hypothetical protein
VELMGIENPEEEAAAQPAAPAEKK